MVHGVRKGWGDGARLPVMLAFLLCGYYGAHLFIEVQARYRYFLMPVLFLLAGARTGPAGLGAGGRSGETGWRQNPGKPLTSTVPFKPV